MKKLEPVHVFNSHGLSMQTGKFLEARIVELEADNERLKRLLKKAIANGGRNSDSAKEAIRLH